MSLPITPETTSIYLSLCLEGFLYGFYSGIFIIYVQHHASKERADKGKDIIFYALCVLYLLSTGVMGCVIAIFVTDLEPQNISIKLYSLDIVASTLFGGCDVIAQSILIYRCWIVWDQNIRVVIIPAILAIAFLATWIAAITGVFIDQGQVVNTGWSTTLGITGLIISMSVNALVTGLIVFRIFKVFREVKATSDKVLLKLNVTGGTKLQSTIFIIIESGMALFSIQLARLVVTIVGSPGAQDAFQFIDAIHDMLNGITPTIILVRVSMGLSFYDETSLVETAESILRFASSVDQNSMSERETESIKGGNLCVAPLNPGPGMGSISQERGDDDEVCRGDDIQTVDR